MFLFFLAIWASSNIFHQPSKQNQLKEVRTCYLFWEIPCCVHTVSEWARTRDVHITSYFSKKDTNSQVFGIQGKSMFLENYPPRNKHALATCWLRDYFPFGDVNFSRDMLVWGSGEIWNTWRYNTWSLHWISISLKIIISITNGEIWISRIHQIDLKPFQTNSMTKIPKEKTTWPRYPH